MARKLQLLGEFPGGGSGATAEEAAQIEQNKQNIATLDRTKLAASELPNAVNEALAQAKASGAFDGADGKDGKDGVDGQPGKDGTNGKDGADGQPGADGKDYVLTEADKQEIAQEAAGKVQLPTTLPNPNALTFTGAATGTYDGSAPLTVNIPEGGGVTDEQVETAVNAWLDENGEAALTGGGWRKIATHVWDGNTEYQPLTLDYATGEMTFAEAPPIGWCMWPVPNMGSVTNVTDAISLYSKIPNEFLKGNLNVFKLGTNGYVYGDKTSIVQGGANVNVDLSAFHFETAKTVHTFSGLNAKQIKVRLVCPGGNEWLNNSGLNFNVRLSNGTDVSMYTSSYNAKSLCQLVDQTFTISENLLTNIYSVSRMAHKDRTNANQSITRYHESQLVGARIVPNGTTITEVYFPSGNGNYRPCNGTVVEVYEFVG